MATAGENEMEKCLEEKLEEIGEFCGQVGYTVKSIIKSMKGNRCNFSKKYRLVIDILWKSIEGLKRKEAKAIFVDVIQIIGSILALIGRVVPVVGFVADVVLLVVYFLRIAFHLTDIKESLKPKLTNDVIVHELAGLAERLEKTEIFINEVDVQEHVDEPTLQGLISNVDIHIAVDQLGTLKSRINNLMTGGQKDLRMCLHFLTLFVRISTLRHSLLFRFMTCLRLKNYSTGTITALKTYIEKERLANQSFLEFFSLPSLEKAAVLTVFDPSEGNVDELVQYLKELRLPLQDLEKHLHDRFFLIKPSTNPSIFLGRPLPSLSSIRAMPDSTDVYNSRIRFKFTAVTGKFNLFYIRSPNTGQYMYMKENTYCKYDKMPIAPENAMWRVIHIGETDKKDEIRSCFLFCTKKWPEKIIYMENSLYKCAKGRRTTAVIGQECLFTLIPPGDRPINIPITSPGQLTEEPDESRVCPETPKTKKHNMTDAKHCIPALTMIHVFLDKHDIKIKKEIEQIDDYLSENESNTLHFSMKRIAESLTYLGFDEMNEHTMQGLVEIMSINFQLFQETFPYCSILRKLLRVCGLILSRIWQVRDIEKFVCSQIETGYSDKSSVAKDMRDLVRFSSFLREIERADNIFERNITDMWSEGKFCEELPCLAELKKHPKTKSAIVSTCVKVSILQLSVLWEMYAVAKLPGHSEKTANHLLRVILSQKENDIKFFECNMLPKANHEMSLVKKYLTCLGCGLQSSERTDDTKLTTKGKLGLKLLTVVPRLNDIFKKSLFCLPYMKRA